jgi:ABC-type multidrug transport system fused ATPase/permease subunit
LISSKFSSLSTLVRGKGSYLILIYLLVIGSTAMESIGIASFYPITEMLQDSSQLDYYRDKLVAWIPELEILDKDQFLFYSLLVVAALFVFKNVFLILAGYGNIWVIIHLYCSWMNQIFNIYMNKPYSFFLENKAGDLVQRKIMQANKASTALRVFILFLGGMTNIVGVLFVLCVMSFKATLAIAILMIPLYFVTMKISRGKVYTAGDRIVELEKKGFGLTTELLSGIKQLKVFCAEDYFQKRIGKIWNEYAQHSIQNNFLHSLPRPVLETLVVLAGVGTLLMVENISDQGKEIFPALTVFAVGLYRILPLSAACSVQTMTLAAFLPSAETVANILKEEVKETRKLAIPSISKKIEFQNVSFSYNNHDAVLENVSLKFEKNKFYGIVGPSGSGKSTIIDLMTGFFKPTNGRIFIDGINLNDADISTWLCQIGLISQDAFIFSGTIEDNICFGVDVEDRNHELIIEAARIAYADEFIEQMSEGYQTIVGERGTKLSGGQRQRLAIARAIYLDPPVLIFDEATSSLDANSESKVQEAIEALHGKRTVIVVAHRLVTVASADYIFVIEDGYLAEEGKHEDLRVGDGLYSRLCSKQRLD